MTQERTIARRAFVTELTDSTYKFQETQDETAPIYLLLPTGGKANRVFLVGTITETTVNLDAGWVAGTFADPTDTIEVGAGQYESDYVLAEFYRLEPPETVAIAGKLRVHHPNDGTIKSRIRVEEIANATDADQERWILDAARRTLRRLRDEAGQHDRYERAQEVYAGQERYRDAALTALERIREEDSDQDRETEPRESETVVPR